MRISQVDETAPIQVRKINPARVKTDSNGPGADAQHLRHLILATRLPWGPPIRNAKDYSGRCLTATETFK